MREFFYHKVAVAVALTAIINKQVAFLGAESLSAEVN